jgi:thiamine biosynthesis lipoprotein
MRSDPTAAPSPTSANHCPHAPSLGKTGAGVVVLLFLLAGGWWYSTAVRTPEPITLTGSTMGTTYTVKMPQAPERMTAAAVQAELDRMLADINRRMSTYDPDSELSRFNRNPDTDWVSVSPELLFVVREAQRISALTEGAFDITVGPLVNLWGFGPTPTDDAIPSEQAIAEAQARVGYQRLRVRDHPPGLKKERADMYVDLSAIAKGYAVDRLADYLESLAVADYMVEIGGELRVKGRNAQGTPWRIAIEKPTPGQRSAERILHLSGQGIATSGDYRNYFEKDGQRYSHEINPQTGKPIRHELVSVTVVHPAAATADALATGLIVMGPKHGFELAEQQGLAVLFIMLRNGAFEEKSTTAFAPYRVD